MSTVTLLSDGSTLTGLLSRNFHKTGERFFILSDDANDRDEAEKKEQNNKIQWNKRSPLSARNSILSILNSHDRIDSAILIYQPGGFNKTFHETSSAVYDLQVDRWIKGYGYMLKELIQLFLKQKGGDLNFILDTGGIKMLTPLENAIYSYLKNLVKNLSVLYQNEDFRLYCFETESERREEFLDFMAKIRNDSKYSPGKIYRFGDKKSLFDFSRN